MSTSLDAWEKINADGLLPKLKLRVYNCIKDMQPCAQFQVSRRLTPLGKLADGGTYRTRFSELEEYGVIRKIGKRVENPDSSYMAELYEITCELPKKPTRRKTKKELLQALKKIAETTTDLFSKQIADDALNYE